MSQESVPYIVDLELAQSAKVAPAKESLELAMEGAQKALGWLRDASEKKTIELLGIPARRDDVAKAREVAANFSDGATDIAILGIGGSSLGGKALKALERRNRPGPRVTFFDNPDPVSWHDALSSFDLRTTRFVVISKSGGTAETLIQALTAADAIEKAGGGKYLKHHFVAITEPRPNVLRKFSEAIDCPVLDHPTGVGGRYSVLTMVGIFPALLMGLDVERLRAGAAAALSASLVNDAAKAPPATGAALHHALEREGRLNETILWSYADRLHVLGDWWRQLWAESLGKNGKGSTPVSALGPVDQHSQLQLFRDGPGRSLYTILSTDTEGKGAVAPRERSEALGLSYLAGRSIGDLVAVEARATAETLARNGRPVRKMHVAAVDEYSMGALMMHFMLETILMGRLMDVDPFDQPGVEEGKLLARDYLSKMR